MDSLVPPNEYHVPNLLAEISFRIILQFISHNISVVLDHTTELQVQCFYSLYFRSLTFSVSSVVILSILREEVKNKERWLSRAPCVFMCQTGEEEDAGVRGLRAVSSFWSPDSRPAK